MDANIELRALAREREARSRSHGAALSTASVWAASRATRLHGMPSSGFPLVKAHRSVRLAHSLGLLSCSTGLLLGLCYVPRPGLCSIGMLFMGFSLGHSGGTFVHGLIPEMLREDLAPAELQTCDGLLCQAALVSFRWQLALEWEVFVENLAFICTYGKNNCLTSQMYSGELSIGKIWTLVGAKLREGVIRC